MSALRDWFRRRPPVSEGNAPYRPPEIQQPLQQQPFPHEYPWPHHVAPYIYPQPALFSQAPPPQSSSYENEENEVGCCVPFRVHAQTYVKYPMTACNPWQPFRAVPSPAWLERVCAKDLSIWEGDA